MRKSLLIAIALFVLDFGTRPLGLAAQAGPQAAGDGKILETVDGFPYPTYEKWLEFGRGQMAFDEARIRSQFPPEAFKENKDKLRIPAATYEEWLAQLKRRSEAMLAKWPAMEAEARRSSPPELFREFKEIVDCSRIRYSSGGLTIVGFILKPRTPASGPSPVIIYNHGGNSQVSSIDDARLLHLAWLVRAGYVVVASQYRGCGGSEGNDEVGGADIADVLNLIPLIESLPYADAARIGMLGWSRGGLMTYLALAKTNRLAAAVIGSAPTDLYAEIRNRPVMESMLQRQVPDYAGKKDAVLRARSARYWPEQLCRTTPILILQGSEDRNCVPESALQMALLLQGSRHPFRLIFFESGSHGLSEHQEEVNRQTILWFDKHLRKSS